MHRTTELVIGSIVVITAVAVVLFFMIQRKGPVQETLPAIVSGQEAADGIAKLISGSAQTNGSFTQYYQCVRGGNCIARPETPGFTGHAVAFLLLYGERMHSLVYRAQADRAMNVILGECAQAAQKCADNFFAIETYYDLTKEEKYRDALVRAGDPIIDALRSMNMEDGGDVGRKIVYPNYAHKLQRLYAETGDRRYYDLLENIAQSVLSNFDTLAGAEMYSNDSTTIRQESSNLVSRVLVPAYVMTGNGKYVGKIREVYIDGAIGDNAAQFREIRNPFDNMLRAMEGLLDLGAHLGPEDAPVYKEQADALMRYMMLFAFDSNARPIFDGTDNFVTGHTVAMKPPEGISYATVNFKGVKENGHAGWLIFKGGYTETNFSLDQFRL